MDEDRSRTERSRHHRCWRHPGCRENGGPRRGSRFSNLPLAVGLAGGVDRLRGRHRAHGGRALRSTAPLREHPDRYFERQRLTGPAEVTPVILSWLTRRSENVSVASDNFSRSPCIVPLTGPESSGCAATVTLPVTLVPF